MIDKQIIVSCHFRNNRKRDIAVFSTEDKAFIPKDLTCIRSRLHKVMDKNKGKFKSFSVECNLRYKKYRINISASTTKEDELDIMIAGAMSSANKKLKGYLSTVR